MSFNLKPGLFYLQIVGLDVPVLALSWRQPFLHLMLPPHNKIETRSWIARYRGWVLMCASKVPYGENDLFNLASPRQFSRILKAIDEDENLTYEEYILPLSHALAIGYLADCRRMQPEDADRCYIKYDPKLYCHIYTDVHPIKPIPWKGVQGWKKVDKTILSQIEIVAQ